MIDSEGYRLNIGIVLANRGGKVLWARRFGQEAWQFPQGGIKGGESPEQALYRELYEELGLKRNHVEIVGYTRGWLRYTLPKRFIRRHCQPRCIGQKQIWFLLHLIGRESALRLNACDQPEFDCWKWVSYWYPTQNVIFFKREVYRRALRELAPMLSSELMLPPDALAEPIDPPREQSGPQEVFVSSSQHAV
ncbi:MAG: RNA pyrophosphohydrolase [Gammaproteobacteria bacterium]|jgi:putative (di)nucleoside polyphosphate hydrolase